MATPTAGASVERPTHDITLSDGTTTIGLFLRDSNGRFDPTRITRNAYPRTSTQIRQGEQKYSDLELPYNNTAQDDWSGGRAQDNFSDDETKYLEGHGLDTLSSGQIIMGPRDYWTVANGIENGTIAMPGDGEYFPILTPSVDWLATPFTAKATYTMSAVYLWLKVTGSPNDLTIAIYSDSGNQPNASLSSTTYSASSHPYGDGRGAFVKIPLTQALSNGTVYHVVLTSTNSIGDDLWSVLTEDGSSNGTFSGDGSAWTSGQQELRFVIEDNSTNFRGMFFEYKNGLYAVTQPDDGGTSSVYINGDRGTADSNSGDKSKLNDATKGWDTDLWIGSIVLITEGSGSDEKQPWRKITDSDATSLTVSPSWDIAHTTSTEYVILGSDQWTSITSGAAAYITDVAVSKDWVYFAYGTANVVTRYQAYTSSGAWTERNNAEIVKAKYLKVIRDNTNEVDVLWGGYNDSNYNGSGVWKAWIPPRWGDLYSPIRQLTEIGPMWDSEHHTASRSTTLGQEGAIVLSGGGAVTSPAGENLGAVRWSGGVQFDDAYAVAFQMWKDEAWSANEVRLELYDTPDTTINHNELADFVLFNDTDAMPTQVFYYDGTNYDLLTNLSVPNNTFSHTFTLLNTHYFYIGYTSRFDAIEIDVNAVQKNSTAAVLDVEFWDGDSWVAIGAGSVTDTTESPEGTTLGRDGIVSWTLDTDHTKGHDTGDSDMSQDLYWVRIAPNNSLDDCRIEYIAVSYSGTDQTEPINYLIDLTLANDGDTGTEALIPSWDTTDYMYIGHTTRFTDVVVNMGTSTNDVESVLTAEYFNGDTWASLTITDGTDVGGDTLKQDGTIEFDAPIDWAQLSISGGTGYWIRLKVSVALTAYIDIAEIAIKNFSGHLSLNANLANYGEWEWFEWVLSESNIVGPSSRLCYGMGFSAAGSITDPDFRIRGRVWLTRYGPEFIPLGNGDKVTGIEAYGDQHKNPWVFTDSTVYEIQTESGDKPVPLPLGEIDALRSETNGLAHCVNDVYLYFNLGQHIQRYFNRTLENIGFNKDEGLPNARRGTVSALLSFPGRVYASVTATDSDLISSGFSSVLVREGGGWHEVYRAPKGLGIYALKNQTVPGNSSDRLWVFMDGQIVWLPLPSNTFNPRNDSNYRYTHEGWMVTSWFDMGLLDVQKLVKSIKFFSENLSSGVRSIEVAYQLESGSLESGWTDISSLITTSPFQEIDLSSSNDVSARRIRFRFIVLNEDDDVTPIIKAYVIESLLNFTPKYSYTFPFSAFDQERELVGVRDPVVAAETVINQLDTWSGSPPTVLTLRCNYAAYDNKTVFAQPAGLRPVYLNTDRDYEEHIGEITLLEA